MSSHSCDTIVAQPWHDSSTIVTQSSHGYDTIIAQPCDDLLCKDICLFLKDIFLFPLLI